MLYLVSNIVTPQVLNTNFNMTFTSLQFTARKYTTRYASIYTNFNKVSTYTDNTIHWGGNVTPELNILPIVADVTCFVCMCRVVYVDVP